MGGDAWFLLIVPLFIAIAVLSMVWHFRRSARMVDGWAAQNGCRIINREYRWLLRGPFWWRTSKHMAVYHVTLEDREGRIRRAYLRCGGWFLGLLSDQVDVEWDE